VLGQENIINVEYYLKWPWWFGAVVIASALGIEDRGFEKRSLRYFYFHVLIWAKAKFDRRKNIYSYISFKQVTYHREVIDNTVT
jgi:hypothetical protein